MRKELFEAARSAEKNAYAPYSGFRVGAALLTQKGAVFSGCNVENISYGATICAERNAITTAVAAEGPEMKIKELTVVTDCEEPWPPCALCLQVIAEFALPDTTIFLVNFKGKVISYCLNELLPHPFSSFGIVAAEHL